MSPSVITVITTGRSGLVNTTWGTIEFTHTRQSRSTILNGMVEIGRPLRFARAKTELSDLLPRQRIRLKVANVPAYTGDPLPLRRNYEGLADSYGGTDSFLVTTETSVKIASDKVKSLISSSAVNPRYRDIWDLGWAARNHIAPNTDFVAKKIQDYGVQDFDTLRDDLLDRLDQWHAG